MTDATLSRIEISVRILSHYFSTAACPLLQDDVSILRGWAISEVEKNMELDELACIVIHRAIRTNREARVESSALA